MCRYELWQRARRRQRRGECAAARRWSTQPRPCHLQHRPQQPQQDQPQRNRVRTPGKKQVGQQLRRGIGSRLERGLARRSRGPVRYWPASATCQYLAFQYNLLVPQTQYTPYSHRCSRFTVCIPCNFTLYSVHHSTRKCIHCTYLQ